MNRYTFLMEFRGGTYISQILADDIVSGMISWARAIDPSEIKYFGEKAKLNLLDLINLEKPTPLDGLKNIWYFSMGLNVGFIGVNIIKTDNDFE